MKEYLIRLEDDSSPTDICDIDEDGAVWVCHHYGKLVEATADSTIVELPPHGRLADITQFVKDIINSKTLNNEFTSYQLTLLRQLAKNAPVILEASR